MKIPFKVITSDNKVIKGYLPNIYKDITMFIPKSRNEFIFKVVTETSSKLLNEPIKLNSQLNFTVGVFIIIEVIGKVQLLIPGFETNLDPPACEEFTKILFTMF